MSLECIAVIWALTFTWHITWIQQARERIDMTRDNMGVAQQGIGIQQPLLTGAVCLWLQAWPKE